MSRNIRITLIMLCLTVVIHLMIYYEKSKQLPSNAIGHLRELLPDHGASDGSLIVPAESIQVNKTSLPSAPPGDGQLYKLIETSKAPFLPGYRKQVLIVAYQRVGSSFFGQLFDSNPSFFYVYEPLDSVYTEMYGTQGGFNVPSDITYLPNGEPRYTPMVCQGRSRVSMSDNYNNGAVVPSTCPLADRPLTRSCYPINSNTETSPNLTASICPDFSGESTPPSSIPNSNSNYYPQNQRPSQTEIETETQI